MNEGLYMSDSWFDRGSFQFFQIYEKELLTPGNRLLDEELGIFVESGATDFPRKDETYKQLTSMNLVRWEDD